MFDGDQRVCQERQSQRNLLLLPQRVSNVMRKILWTSAGVGLLSFVLKISTYVWPEFFLLLLAMVLFLTLVVLFFRFSWLGVIRWRPASSLWPLPSLICLVSILFFYYAASPIG